MTKCIYCGVREEEPKGWTRKFCDTCIKDKPFENSLKGFHARETVYLKGYGNESAARIKEMERRVVLPYKKEGGGYYLGRLGENGKVSEKHPNYY